MIYVDACCNKKTGDSSYASVIEYNNFHKNDLIEEHKDLFDDMQLKRLLFPIGEYTIIVAHTTDVASQHNNYGELLAFIAGLRIAKRIGSKHLYSDSDLIIKYWSKNVSKTVKDPIKRKYIQECIYLRKEFEENGGTIIKVSGDFNEADLGFHRH